MDKLKHDLYEQYESFTVCFCCDKQIVYTVLVCNYVFSTISHRVNTIQHFYRHKRDGYSDEIIRVKLPFVHGNVIKRGVNADSG